MENMNEKFSVKNLLFSKALPNYVIPVPANGHKIYTCTDCGDKFLFESSLNDHVTRKSVVITYVCRHCNQTITFFNRCNLLSHIRSHVFRTATINVTDLNVEPLPLNFFNIKIAIPAPKPTQTNQLIPTNQVKPINKLTIVGEIPPKDDCIITAESTAKNTQITEKRDLYNQVICLECKENLSNSPSTAAKDRASHYMQFSNEVYSCPVCLFALPTTCALKSHLRLHLKCPVYCCPECGSTLGNKNINYPYNHDCEGFKMMRATARLKCGATNCRICFHPNDLREHMKNLHMKEVFKCPFCVVACFNEESIYTHFKTHNMDNLKPLIFYKCELCPGKFVLQSRIESHIKSHKIFVFYPCWPCGAVFKDVPLLLMHYLEKHKVNFTIQNIVKCVLSEIETLNDTGKVYRVVKRCDQCQRSFTYRCQYSEIHSLPNECPYKCTSTFECSTELDETPYMPLSKTNNSVMCHLCNANIIDNQNEIKKHYSTMHKTEKCLDAKIVLTRIDINKYRTQRINVSRTKSSINKKTIDKRVPKRKGRRQRIKILKDPLGTDSDQPNIDSQDETISCDTPPNPVCYICKICGNNFEQKQSLEKHLITHRDSCMAYQCMECGQSFVVKPSFSKHLLLEHSISDVETYIKEKQCYNENALIKYQSSDIIYNEPLRENQCKICREDFNEPEDLAMHFRVHGMAFLMKNNQSK